MVSAGRDEIRAAVVARYAGLARAAQAGQAISDGDPDAGCSAPGYPDTGGLPAAAVRASLGCGNPVAVADLRPGETVLDLGSGGGIDVLLSARRVGPAGKAYGLDMTEEMLAWPGPTPAPPARRTWSSCVGRSRRSRCRTARWT